MIHKKNKLRNMIALMSMLSLCATTLTGCGEEESIYSDQIKVNETVTENSKWINSSVVGSIDQSTSVRLEDDYYTYINKDEILGLDVTIDEPVVYGGGFDDGGYLYQLIDEIAVPKDEYDGSNGVGMDEADYIHEQELISIFASKVLDMNYRNEQGVEPIRKYLEIIDGISSIDEMTDYLCSTDGQRLVINGFVSVNVEMPEFEKSQKAVIFRPDVYNISHTGSEDIYYASTSLVARVLERLGYSKSEISNTIMAGTRIEDKLRYKESEIIPINQKNTIFSFEQLKEYNDCFPIYQLLKSLQLDGADQYLIYDTEYMKSLKSVYKEKDLEDIKAYLKIATILEAKEYLDTDTYNYNFDTPFDFDNATYMSELKRSYLEKNLGVAFNNVFVAKTFTHEDKEKISDLIDDIVKYYKQMLTEEEWLSENTRKNAIDKLSSLTVHVIYPDEFEDCNSLQFDKEDSGIDIIADIRSNRLQSMHESLGNKVDASSWDFSVIPTVEDNACYKPDENAIYIYGGHLTGDRYSKDAPVEKLYGVLGTVIGHEISHGFDSNGSMYGADGSPQNWWETSDKDNFNSRVAKVQNACSAYRIARKSGFVSGKDVKEEMTADLGGVKCMLGLAKSIDGFDYDLFFRSYAEAWAMACTYEKANNALLSDEHPPAFLRVNLVLQQYDEFLDTYHIKDSDGMYLATKDRIKVW